MSRDGSAGMLVLIGIALLLVSEARYNSTPEGKREVQLRRIRNHVREVEKKHGQSPELRQHLKEFEAEVIDGQMRQFIEADNPKDGPYEDER